MTYSISIYAPILILGLAVIQLLRTVYKPGLRRLPGPWVARFSRVWNFFAAKSGKLHEYIIELHEKHGPIIRVGPNHVSVSDPSQIPQIYGISSNFTKTQFYTTFNSNSDGKQNDNLFTELSPAAHKRQKRAVTNAYAMSSMLSLEPLVEECVDILLDRLEKFCAMGKAVNLGAWLQWYAFDVVGEVTFSKRFGFMEQERDIRDMISQIEGGMMYCSVVGQYPEMHKLMLGSRLFMRITSSFRSVQEKNPLSFILPFAAEEIQRHSAVELEAARSSKDFLSRLQEQKEDQPDSISDHEIYVHCLTNLLAGSDTTAISLRAIVYMLIKNPHSYKKLVDEIDQLDSEGKLSRIVTFEQSLSMPYLQAAIKEAMRLHPAVGFPLERYVPAGGAVICNQRLPEGTIVGMNAWVVHRNKTLFGEDAHLFKPERWIENSEEKIKAMNRASLAFGYGSRTCIGKNISILEMSKLIPQLFRRFDIEMERPDMVWELHNYWFVRQTGLLCRLTPRCKS